MDDVQAFIHMKMEEISDFNNPSDLDTIIEKIMDTWNDKIASRYAQKLDKMNVNEKIRLFKETKVPNLCEKFCCSISNPCASKM